MGGFFDAPARALELDKLEQQISSPGFWDDNEAAQKVVQQRSRIEKALERQKTFETGVSDAEVLFEFAQKDKDSAAELETLINKLDKEVSEAETTSLLSGETDANNAICSIQAGAGGTDAQDFAQMLLRMYLRWAERKRFATALTDRMDGEEAGIKSATVEIEGEWAYGYLSSERGVHRLVRISPFDSSARRHTSFALVEVLPIIDEDIEIEINPDDLRVDVFRAGSAGGQHMQKNSTAVRITHLPSGIVVQCQNERSQTQNKLSAMRVLRGKLYDIELQKIEEERSRLKGKHVEMGWGNQIRSYVLQPYQMVKDLRTDYEVGNPGAVLDGDLDGFMEAWLKDRVGGPQVEG